MLSAMIAFVSPHGRDGRTRLWKQNLGAGAHAICRLLAACYPFVGDISRYLDRRAPHRNQPWPQVTKALPECNCLGPGRLGISMSAGVRVSFWVVKRVPSLLLPPVLGQKCLFYIQFWHICFPGGLGSPQARYGYSLMRGWRNTVGSLMELFWLKKAYHGPQFAGICVKNRGVRFHRIRDVKEYYFSIPPTSPLSPCRKEPPPNTFPKLVARKTTTCLGSQPTEAGNVFERSIRRERPGTLLRNPGSLY